MTAPHPRAEFNCVNSSISRRPEWIVDTAHLPRHDLQSGNTKPHIRKAARQPVTRPRHPRVRRHHHRLVRATDNAALRMGWPAHAWVIPMPPGSHRRPSYPVVTRTQGAAAATRLWWSGRPYRICHADPAGSGGQTSETRKPRCRSHSTRSKALVALQYRLISRRSAWVVPKNELTLEHPCVARRARAHVCTLLFTASP